MAEDPEEREVALGRQVSIVRADDGDDGGPRARTKRCWGALNFYLGASSLGFGGAGVWYFPIVCFSNGGGTFILLYVLCVYLVGAPVMLLEAQLGQQHREKGLVPTAVFVPILKGVGLASMLLSFFGSSYFAALAQWSLLYIYDSCTGMTWARCDNVWNTQNCQHWSTPSNITDGQLANQTRPTWPSEEFFLYQIVAGDDWWTKPFLLAVLWVFAFVVVCPGLHRSWPVVWAAAVAPHAILLLLLVRAAMLPEWYNNFLYFVSPDLSLGWHLLYELGMALTLSVTSLGIGYGAIPVLASRNNFRHHYLRDVLLCCTLHVATCLLVCMLFSGFVGFVAFQLGVSVTSVVFSITDGLGVPSYLFQLVPESMTALPMGSLFIVSYFAMLLILALRHQWILMDGLCTVLSKSFWPFPFRRGRRAIVACLAAGALFLCNLGAEKLNLVPLLNPNGEYYEVPVGCRVVLAVCLLEAVAAFLVGGPCRMAAEGRKMADGVTGAGACSAIHYWVLSASGAAVAPVALGFATFLAYKSVWFPGWFSLPSLLATYAVWWCLARRTGHQGKRVHQGGEDDVELDQRD